MSRRSAPKIERRSRKEIDRNYFFGDLLIRTGIAAGLVIIAIGAITPFSWMEALRDGMVEYVAIMTTFGVIAMGAVLYGRHLRRSATHWDVAEE